MRTNEDPQAVNERLSVLDDVTHLSARALSSALHARRLTCVSVMEAYLDRIERLNPQINAIISLRPRAELIIEAQAADRKLDEGRSKGWLHGFPFAIKDLSQAKGLICSRGSPLYAQSIATTDDIHVARVRAAGAIIIAKTNTPEFGFGSHSYNPVFGVTRNPANLSVSAGGSSGGAAAALAARLIPVADGSDMMGSLRNPAGFTGIVGYRPSYGRVPSDGLDLYLTQLATNGPMGRTVADVAALLATQAGYDPRAPLSLADEGLSSPAGPAFPKGRVAWLGDCGGYLPFDPGVLEASEQGLATFDKLGVTIEHVTPDFDLSALWIAWVNLRHMLIGGMLKGDYADAARRSTMKPEALWEIESGFSLQASDVFAASLIRSNWHRYLLTLFERYDALILPTAQVFPFPVEWHWPKQVGGRTMDTYHRWMEVVVGASMAGLPTAAMPSGLSKDGLPAGLQIIGPPRADGATLAMAQAYEHHYSGEKPQFDKRLQTV